MRTLLRWLLPIATTLPGVAFAQFPKWTTNGSNPTELLGSSVVRIHDYDADGTTDLLAGAPGFDCGVSSNCGALYVLSGQSGAVLASVAGGGALERLGASVAQAGDITGDGIAELCGGAPGFGGSNPTGAIRVFDGSNLAPLGILVGPAAGARIGERIAVLSDVNSDGRPEIATGARGISNGPLISCGAVIVFDVATGQTVRTVFGSSNFEAFGSCVSPIDDVNFDGSIDLLVGAPGADPFGLNGAGIVNVVDPKNGAILLTLFGTAAGDGLGSMCVGISDVTGDGVPEIIAAAPSASPNGLGLAGSVFVFSAGSGSILQRFDGLSANDQLGSTLGALDDIDRDGADDFAFGSTTFTVSGKANAGLLQVYSSANLTLLYRFEGGNAGDGFGGTISAVGDINFDLRQDFAIGWPSATFNGVDTGNLRLCYGQFPSLTISTTGQFGTNADVRLQTTPNAMLALLVGVPAPGVQVPYGLLCVGLSPFPAITFTGPTAADGLLFNSILIPATGLAPNVTFAAQFGVFDPNSLGGFWLGNCVSVTVHP